MGNSLEKGKSMPVGTITNGFKKIAEGKWRKVSKYGMTMEEHRQKMNQHNQMGGGRALNSKMENEKLHHLKEANKHKISQEGLDENDYSDVDVVGKEKEEEDFDHTFFDDYKLTGEERKLISDVKSGKKPLNDLTDLHDNSSNIDQRARVYLQKFMNKKIKKSTANDIEKALVTLEIGYLAGQVSDDQIKEARELVKAERAGHKYFKREADGKGGWKYYYTEAQYKKEKGEKSDTPNTKTTEEQYKKANAAGLKHRTTGDFWSYYTPTLQIAYNLGTEGISIQEVEPITAFRFGKAPENFISWNYRDNTPEKGLSVYTENSIVRGEFADRKKYKYTGLPVAKGGDGETLILAFDAKNND